ncbi:MAG TPA: cytochrome c biogenesis protein ResB, partial [Eoetvoesiella sp.]
FNQTIEVNEPLRYKGVTVYQSSFDDGGSKLDLIAYPLLGSKNQPFDIKGVVGKPAEINVGDKGEIGPLTLDLTGLRVINVENLTSDAEPQPKAMLEHVAAVTGSAAGAKNEHLRNVGPSVQYKVTGSDGQSHEYNNYMLPMVLDGSPVFLAGVRETPSQNYRYMRIPADDNNSVAEFMGLRAALHDPVQRTEAATRFSIKNAGSVAQQPLLQKAAEGALDAFSEGGFNAIVDRVPESEREKVLSFAVPMIQLSLAELRDIARTNAGQAPVDNAGPNASAQARWTQLALLALANLPDYPAPVFMSLKSFEHVEASVFQVARSPGKNTVYLGCIFLVLGVFSMFYIRDRRIWVWVKPHEQGSELLAAMTSQRRTLDFNHEFERFKEAFKRLTT